MKTYILDTINKLQRFSESLDVKTILCNKSWRVFNDSNEKEVYIFQEDGSLIISNSGRVTNGSWQYLSANKSIIINGNNQSYMLHPAFIDEVIFALNVDGTQQCVFMIDENNQKNFVPTTFSQLVDYFQEKESKKLGAEKLSREQLKYENSIIDLRASILNDNKARLFTILVLGFILTGYMAVYMGKYLISLSSMALLPLLLVVLVSIIITVWAAFYTQYSYDKKRIVQWIKENPNDERASKLLWESFDHYLRS